MQRQFLRHCELDATDVVIGAHVVDQSRTTVLIRPQFFDSRRRADMTRSSGARGAASGRQGDNFRRIPGLRACDRWG
jgi:hypothetical protein